MDVPEDGQDVETTSACPIGAAHEIGGPDDAVLVALPQILREITVGEIHQTIRVEGLEQAVPCPRRRHRDERVIDAAPQRGVYGDCGECGAEVAVIYDECVGRPL